MSSDEFDIDEFLSEFVSECRDSMEFAVQDVLNLETKRDQESVDRIFRALHSVKGNASMFGLLNLSEFVHKVEDACSDIRSGDREIDKAAINVLLKSFDLIEDAFEKIIKSGSDEINYSSGYDLIKNFVGQTVLAESKDKHDPVATPVPGSDAHGTEAVVANIDSVQENTAAGVYSCVNSFGIISGQHSGEIRENLTALVVDDDFAVRKIFTTYISKFMPCYVAKDGVEAIQAVTESFLGNVPHFDLIIMDIMMPIVDGLQACKAIRQIEDSKNISSFAGESKIFIASGIDDEKIMHKAVYECGADTYLTKPVRLNELRRQLLRYRLIDPE
ncbi:response regulator [Desulfovibrio gilichinskyi]|uniref:Hpt domain-containing protein n=1 Tax=Desulfovibrio gilichinskyi TaxID=1519643 RepID=A0A1X7CE40_9BACT|nr:response regulator [Desulfovibrio gilichinskyi]SME95070.1 Hpt domain-containing protein [Desulfovibrio gilichinskyi]